MALQCIVRPKPHQEHLCNIEDFVWRFCVNFIPLNQVTCLVAYSIPCCNMAVEGAFGGSWIWPYNALMGYHWISASEETQEKIAFQEPDAIKWTYKVMPFGPTNGPAIFLTIIHNVNSVWKESTRSEGLHVGTCVGTAIIINDILNWAKSLKQAIQFIVCQLCICKAYRLTLSKKKSFLLKMS
jgi:hypothetical protein